MSLLWSETNMIQKFSDYLWEQDPGLFRLKHSFKTVLAITLSSLIFCFVNSAIIIFSALAAAFSMQGIETSNKKKQFGLILLLGVIYLTCLLSSNSLKSSPILTDSLLICAAFIVLYIRRFGQQFIQTSVFAWIAIFFGIALPRLHGEQYLGVSVGMLVGNIIAALVYVFVLPENKEKLFYTLFSKYLNDYATNLNWLLSLLLEKTKLDQFKIQQRFRKNHLLKLIATNDSLINSYNFINIEKKMEFQSIYLRQYALMKILSMIMEGFQSLIIEKPLSSLIKSQLFSLLAIYAAAFSNLSSNVQNLQIEITPLLQVLQKELTEFQICLQQSLIAAESTPVALLNIQLGFRLIYRNLVLLEQANAS